MINKKLIFIFCFVLFSTGFVLADMSDVITEFDGSSIVKGDYNIFGYVEPNFYNVSLQSEQITFKLNNVLNKNITIKAFLYSSAAIPTVNWSWSCDNGSTWNHFEGHRNYTETYKTVEVWHNFTECNLVLISRFPSYGYEKMETFLTGISNNNFTLETIGTSVEGRNIRRIRITNEAIDESKKKIIYLITRQHNYENTAFAIENATNYLLSDDASEIRNRFVWYIVPLADPDAAYYGSTISIDDINMNRAWNGTTKKEVNIIKSNIIALGKVDLFIDFHGYGNLYYNQLDGLNPTLSDGIRKDYYSFQNISVEKFTANSIFKGINERVTYVDGMSTHELIRNGYVNNFFIPEFSLVNESFTFDNTWKSMGQELVISVNEAFDSLFPSLEIKLSEASGTTAYDSSGNGNNGTISGATWNNDGVLVALVNGVDYTINTATGLFTLVNTDYLYSWIMTSWGYNTLSGSNSITNMRNNFTAGVDNISGKIPTVLLIAVIVVILSILVLLVFIWNKMRGIGGNI